MRDVLKKGHQTSPKGRAKYGDECIVISKILSIKYIRYMMEVMFQCLW